MPLFSLSFVRNMRSNHGLKALALLLAVVTWYAIREATSFETVIKDVPLEVIVDEGWSVLDRSVGDVDVLFRGSQGDIRNLNRDQVRVVVDKRRQSEAGASVVRLKPDNVRAPFGARPVAVDPSEITLSLDRESERQVPVKAEIAGSPPEGFEVESVECAPDTVVLHGPQRRIETIDAVRTEPIELEGRLRSFQLNKDIMPPGETWSARVEPERVRVSVTIAERTARKDLVNIRVSALVPSDKSYLVRVKPANVSVEVKGRSDLINELVDRDVVAFIDCADLDRGKKIELPVHVQTPAGIDVVSIEPPRVSAEVSAP